VIALLLPLASLVAVASASGAPDASPAPVLVPLDAPFEAVEVAVNRETSCARSRDGRVACWGKDVVPGAHWMTDGATGRPHVLTGVDDAVQILLTDAGLTIRRPAGVEVVPFSRGEPRKPVSGVGELVSLTRAAEGVCGLRVDGTVVCCGWVSWLEGESDPYVAREVPAIAGVTELACDGWACCVRGVEERCWGKGGLATEWRPPGTPVELPPGRLVMGFDRTCVVGEGVSCWREHVWVPGDEPAERADYGEGLHSVDGDAIVLAFDRECVRRAGEWLCEGSGDDPVRLPGAVDVALDDGHGCAAMADGTVRCWGRNNQGQLGDGRAVFDPRPAAVAGVEGATALAVTHGAVCADVDGGQRCWGSESGSATQLSSLGQLGRGQYFPVGFSGGSVRFRLALRGRWSTELFPTAAPFDPVAVSLDRAHNLCAAGPDGVRCLYSLGEGGIDLKWRPMKGPKVPIVELAPTSVGLVARAEDGSVWTWQDRRFDGDPDFVRVPAAPQRLTPVRGVAGATHIAAGQDAAFVRLTDGRVLTWGALSWDGARPAEPTEVPGFAGATALGANHLHACAVVDGQVRCYGANHHGQCGQPSSEHVAEPAAVQLPGPAVAVGRGREHTCALLADGRVFCWGGDLYGTLGRGRVQEAEQPLRVVGIGPG
jgi:hypothetical protein